MNEGGVMEVAEILRTKLKILGTTLLCIKHKRPKHNFYNYYDYIFVDVP